LASFLEQIGPFEPVGLAFAAAGSYMRPHEIDAVDRIRAPGWKTV